MGHGARLRPNRGPQDEPLAVRPRTGVRRGQHRAPRERRDHDVVVAPERGGRGGPVEPARAKARVIELIVEIREPAGHVAIAASEAPDIDAVALVQALVQGNAVRRQVVGDKRCRHGSSICPRTMSHAVAGIPRYWGQWRPVRSWWPGCRGSAGPSTCSPIRTRSRPIAPTGSPTTARRRSRRCSPATPTRSATSSGRASRLASRGSRAAPGRDSRAARCRSPTAC